MNASARVAVMADPFAFCSSSSVAPIGQPLAPKTLDLLHKVRVEEGLVRPGPESFVVGKQRRCHGGRKGPCSGLHGPDECRNIDFGPGVQVAKRHPHGRKVSEIGLVDSYETFAW